MCNRLLSEWHVDQRQRVPSQHADATVPGSNLRVSDLTVQLITRLQSHHLQCRARARVCVCVGRVVQSDTVAVMRDGDRVEFLFSYLRTPPAPKEGPELHARYVLKEVRSPPAPLATHPAAPSTSPLCFAVLCFALQLNASRRRPSATVT
jgi:hypothetical protein